MSSPFKELEKYWYQKLKESGFEDIEDVSREDRLLKKWTHFPVVVKSIHIQGDPPQSLPTPRFEREERFLDHPKFEEVCLSISNHRNNSLTKMQVKEVWQLYCEGVSKRKIGRDMKADESTIRRVIIKMKAWLVFIDSDGSE